MAAANVAKLIISSTQRSPADQARVMYNNLETQGVAAQRKLYKPPGQAVIDVYVAGKAAKKTPDAIKAAMTAKINELGPENGLASRRRSENPERVRRRAVVSVRRQCIPERRESETAAYRSS